MLMGTALEIFNESNILSLSLSLFFVFLCELENSSIFIQSNWHCYSMFFLFWFGCLFSQTEAKMRHKWRTLKRFDQFIFALHTNVAATIWLELAYFLYIQADWGEFIIIVRIYPKTNAKKSPNCFTWCSLKCDLTLEGSYESWNEFNWILDCVAFFLATAFLSSDFYRCWLSCLSFSSGSLVTFDMLFDNESNMYETRLRKGHKYQTTWAYENIRLLS